MFLFNKSFDEDYEYMMNGYKNGIITEEASTMLLQESSASRHLSPAYKTVRTVRLSRRRMLLLFFAMKSMWHGLRSAPTDRSLL
jgi:hypothetical protein